MGRLGIIIDKSPTDPIPAGVKRLVFIDFDVAPAATGTTNIGFVDTPVRKEVVNGTATPLVTTFTTAPVLIAGPTAANVYVEGRVLVAGHGVPRAIVSYTDIDGITRRTTADSFGYYRFQNVEVGRSYVFNVTAKLHTFAPRFITINDALDNLNFEAEP
ncbi:MAG: hypothetical protein DMF63_02575 [Acidobacteria bacterium]|nr:MAG: hypothetical protein DMF63_02575 [Acidobacteriota bacterium]